MPLGESQSRIGRLMSIALNVVLWVMYITAAVVLAVVRQPRARAVVAIAVPLLALPLWLLSRPNAATPMPLAGGQWTAGPAAWYLTGIVALLLLAAVAQAFTRPAPDVAPGRSLALAFLLAAATLPLVNAGDARTRLTAVALLGAAWGYSRIRTDGWLWLAVTICLTWGAAAGGAAGLWLGIAAAGSLTLWPFTGRETRPQRDLPEVLVQGLPVVAGAAVLNSVAAGGLAGLPLAGATALGLLGVLIGLARLDERSPRGVALALAPALSGLALVAAAWAGQPALLPAVRLAVFAPAVLLLLPAAPGEGRARLPALAGLALVYAAVAGLPLTAGFSALSRLYGMWAPPAGLALVAATAALVTLWLVAVSLSASAPGAAAAPVTWLAVLPAALAALGLLGYDAALLATPPLVWAVLAVPVVAGVLLARFAPGLRLLPGLLREAFSPSLPAARLADSVRRLGTLTTGALADAAGLLEGAHGPLFVLALLLLLMWIGS